MCFLDAGQTLVETLEPKHQAAVIDSELVEDGGIQVIDVDRVVLETSRALAVLIDDVVAVFLRPAVLDASLDSSAGQPRGNASRIQRLKCVRSISSTSDAVVADSDPRCRTRFRK